MCANFKPIKRENLNLFLHVETAALAYDEEAWPGSMCPLIYCNESAEEGMLHLANFGLVPSWAKDRKIGRSTYNCRSETASSKPSFRAAWKAKRFALVPMEGFYEPNYQTGKAVRWQIYRHDGEPFTVAALWETWHNPATNSVLHSFSMLTMNADQHPLMAQFHAPEDEKRSLVVIAPEHRLTWLNASHTDAIALLHPLPSQEFTSAPAPLHRRR